MASKTLSKDQQNFIWISIACVDFIKLPLKDILFNKIKPADLYQRINSSPKNRRDYLRKEQENKCFIPPPDQPDYNDFDVTLLYTLIRNLCSASLNLPSLNPTRGWGKDPDSTHTRIGDDIERLRLMRNKFAHANSAGIPDAEFQALWNDLKSVIQRIQTFMNSMGSNVNYEQKLAEIQRTDFGFRDLQKYNLFLEATLNQLKEERIKDEPEISITGADRVVWGEKTCFEADLKQKEASHWSISWQRVRGSVINQIDISKEKYRDSTRTKLVIHSVCKDDEGEYQAVLARESNGNKLKIESNAVFLHVMGERPEFEVWRVTTEVESITIHYEVKNNASRVNDIKWIKNGEGLDFETQKYVGGSLLDSFLRITSPNETDKGTYSCTLTNAVGCTSKVVTFDIPKATISTESKFYLGSAAQISSKISSTLPPNKHEWQKSFDGNVFYCIDINERKYHETDGLKNPFLVISNTTSDDILYYRLLVWNKIGSCVSNRVFLNVIGNPPNITCSHETCFESRSVKLIANVYFYETQCHAIQKVVWAVNDEEIDQQGPGEKFSKVSVDSPCLTIHNVNCCDAGSYKLTATNAVGSTTSDAIVLNIPEVIFAKFDEKEDGTQWVRVTIKSIPEPSLVQWRKKEKNSDMFQPINVIAKEFEGSSCSFPHPVLVINEREQLENTFQIKIENFIGTCEKTIQDLSNLVPGAMKSENGSSDDINDGSLNETYNDEVAGIKFAILFDDLADYFPEEKFQKLKDHIQSSKKVNDIKSLNEARSARDCFRILDSENLFTKSDVLFVQFLLRRTGCEELEHNCVEYAKGQRALGFYEKQPEDGFKHVYFHVTGDLSNFNKEKRRNIREIVATMVGCKTDRVSLNGYRHSESFIAIVSIEVIYVGKLVAINKQDRYRFVHLDIDYFTVDFIKVILKISKGSERVDYHEHVRKTKQRTTKPPLKRTYVPSRVETSNRVFHKSEDEESTETSLKQKHDMINPDSTSLTEALKTANDLNKDELPFHKRFEYSAHLRSSITVTTSRIENISCLKPNRLWFSTDTRIKEIDEDGHLLRELSINWIHAGYHTISKAGDLLFIKNNDIYMLSSSGEIRNLHIHANNFSCIHSSRLNGDIFVSEENSIKRFNDKGVKLQTICTLKFMNGSVFDCNITENINGDILTIVGGQVVAFNSDGQLKFTYPGEYNWSDLFPVQVCNDTFGHILLSNFHHPCVHLLDINGHLLAKLLIHKNYKGLDSNALCVDEKNNLYIGCENKIYVYKYLHRHSNYRT